MGALAGGVAGHYGGNKMGGHGIIGAIAGAVAGSKLEDNFKAHKHHKHSDQGGNYGGY
jgi:outer membrane lipoprotein SlyB